MAHHLKIDEPHDIRISVTPASHPGTDAPQDGPSRLGLTGKIWGSTFILLAVCALAALGHGGVLAIIILTAAVVGTAAAWGAFGNRSPRGLPSPHKVKELEERLANIETIVSYEEKIMEGKMRSLESKAEAS